ncbi:MAG: hypothetical protein ACREFW_06925 [Rhizomicrobium sp.]
MNGITKLILAGALAVAVAPTIAQAKMMGSMMGSHSMMGTVTDVDSQTGMIDVDAGSHALKLHFPPASLANVKDGDKITVHLSFSKSQ